MDYIRIANREELPCLVVNELKSMGVKYRKEKKPKVLQKEAYNRRIFRLPLHFLELTDVILTNGIVVQIPLFVADACNRILEHVETEGIFRKAGSSMRQKEIRVMLESGMPLGKSHHVIDVGNVIKYFFRELPEPLIPNTMQETLLRSLLLGENQVKAILLTCLLLPPITFNTLRFFMQFLYTVSLSEFANKMSSENLAIIFTPGLMPFANINSHRFANHLRVVQLLIENANYIGLVPSTISNKLEKPPDLYLSNDDTSCSVSTPTLIFPEVTAKKKKKRRSGSLTHMFNGFKKMVGSAIGSSEDLDDFCRENKATISKGITYNTSHYREIKDNLADTNANVSPSHKANKKRKFADPMCAFSSKKKKDLLALFPSNSGGFLPNTPITKDNKKHRLSVNGSRHIGNINLIPIVTSMERRWSIVGSGWSKNKNKQATEKISNNFRNDKYSLNTLCVGKDLEYDSYNEREIKTHADNPMLVSGCLHRHEQRMDECSKCVGGADDINMPKSGIILIEDSEDDKTSIMQNLDTINMSLPGKPLNSGCNLKEVQTQYERMLEETASLSLSTNVELPRRISRDLKIRRSDLQDIRSPSARKIGSLRRRSQDKYCLKNVHNTTMSGCKLISQYDGEELNHLQNTFYTKGNIKRNRQSNDEVSSIEHMNKQDSHLNVEKYCESNVSTEKWLSAEEFFKTLAADVSVSNHVDHAKTPVNCKRLCDITRTTMNHESLSCKKFSNRTPTITAIKPSTTSRVPYVNRIVQSTPIRDDASGRASISRLRTQNAGMVMAKAKLFDGMGICAINHITDNIQNIEHNKNHRDRQTIITNTAIVQRKNTIKGTPVTKQTQSRSSTQRRQHLSNVRHANKIVTQTVYNKEKCIKQRNMKERTSIGIIDSKISTNYSLYSDLNSPRIIKRRQLRDHSLSK